MARRSGVVRWFFASVGLVFLAVAGRMPLGMCRWVGRCLGRLAYYLVPRIRRVALANLELAYGDTLTRAEKIRIAKASAENVGIVAAEFAHIPRLRLGVLERYITVIGLDQVDKDRGALLFGAHLGNWEWMGPVVQQTLWALSGVFRPLDDPRLDAVVGRIRRSFGVGTIPRDRAGSEMLRLLRQGEAVAVLVDQSPRENAVPVTFFGQRTWGTAGVATVAARARVPVHAFSITRDKTGHYTLRFYPPVEMARSDNFRRDLIDNTQRCQDAVEAMIRECPGQWLWFHRRWKPRPRLEEVWRERPAKKE